MISESVHEAFVWVWLPGKRTPVVAGRLEAVNDVVYFNYGQSYLARDDALSLYLPELPLRPGRIDPFDGLLIAGRIADAGPDAWGQRVVMRRLTGRSDRDAELGDLDLLTYLLESGSDRFGNIDFQGSPYEYTPRQSEASLENLVRAAEAFDRGEALPGDVEIALTHGSSIGGARPKVTLAGDRPMIAKFSSQADPYPVVKGEAVAMELADRVGLRVAKTQFVEVLGLDVLLVDRFDREAGTTRRHGAVSALTILGLREEFARYASYTELADVIRARFTDPAATLRELFSRIVFNVLVGNTDDHARNHAAFWNGESLTLTPAYDICPQLRTGGEAAQVMAFGPGGICLSQLSLCVESAHVYLLSRDEAVEVINSQMDIIESEWDDAADEARLTEADREHFWHRQFLNPFALEGYNG